MRTLAFLQDNDNMLHKKIQTPAYCLYREMCLQVITKAAFWMFGCMFACIFRIHRLERKQRMKGTEMEGTKKGGNGKCRLFALVRMAQFTSNASISHGLHLSCERQRSFYAGKKGKNHVRLRNIAQQYSQYVAGLLFWQWKGRC